MRLVALIKLALLVLATLALVSTGSSAWARCDPTIEPDKTDVANGRAAVAANCNCNLARRDYLRCAAAQAKATVTNSSCARKVKSCASHSTCGKPGAVTCCRTSSKGVTKCKVKRSAEKCKPPRKGTACIGVVASCCDACTTSGCATTTTTTTTTTTSGTGSTTTLPVTLNADVQPIFTTNCATAFCHAPPFPSQDLDLSAGQTYAETVDVASIQCLAYKRITPGDPAASYLLFKVQGAGPCFVGSQMPASAPPLSPADIQTISDWISQGALNN